jgi:adenylate cyclase
VEDEWIGRALGNTDKSLELLHRADRLSPRDPRTWFITTGLAMAYFNSERFAESVVCSKKALAQNSRSAVALRLLAAGLARLGQKEQANDAVREVLKIEPQLTISSLRTRMRMLEASVWARLFASSGATRIILIARITL